MIKLVADIDKKFSAETALGVVPLEKLLEILLKKDGRAISRLEIDAGLSHPQLSTQVSLKSYLLGFLELGYEVQLVKKDS